MPHNDRLGILAAALTDNPRQTPRLARIHGFAGILFDAISPGLPIPALTPSGQREFRHLLAGENRQLVGLRTELGAKGFGPGADVDRALAGVAKVLQAAAGLGCGLVCLDVGPLPPAPQQPKPKPRIAPEQAGIIIIPEPPSAAPAPESTTPPHSPQKVDPSFAAQVDAAMRELGGLADRFSVAVAIRSELGSFAAVERALAAAACPWFGVDLDPVAILRDDWDIDEVFSRLGTFVRHVRARDALLGEDRRTKAAVIGRGSVDWRRVMVNLDASGYAGWMTIDSIELPDRVRAAVEGLTHLIGMR